MLNRFLLIILVLLLWAGPYPSLAQNSGTISGLDRNSGSVAKTVHLRTKPQLQLETIGGEFEHWDTVLSDHDPDAFDQLTFRWGKPVREGDIFWMLSRNGQMLDRKKFDTLTVETEEAWIWERFQLDLGERIRAQGPGTYQVHVIARTDSGEAQSDAVTLRLISDDQWGRDLSDIPTGGGLRKRAFIDLSQLTVRKSNEGDPEPYISLLAILFDDDSINMLQPEHSNVRVLAGKGTHGNVPHGPGLSSGVRIPASAGYLEFDLTPIGLSWVQEDPPQLENIGGRQALEQATSVVFIVNAFEENAVKTSTANSALELVLLDLRAQLNKCFRTISLLDYQRIANAISENANAGNKRRPELEVLKEQLNMECPFEGDTEVDAFLRDDETRESIDYLTYLRRRGKTLAKQFGINDTLYDWDKLGLPGPNPLESLVNLVQGIAAAARPDEAIGTKTRNVTYAQMLRGPRKMELLFQWDDDFDSENPDHLRQREEGTYPYEVIYHIWANVGFCDTEKPRAKSGRCQPLRP